MSNATTRGTVGTTPFNDYPQKYGAVSTAQIFYPNCLVGLTTGGYLDKLDDSESLQFVGVTGSVSTEVLTGGSNGDVNIDVTQPRYVEVTFSSVAVTDIGRTVYASDDQTGTFATTTTYANVIGRLHSVVSSTRGVVECMYGGARDIPAVRVLAATGEQTLYKYDANKTIVCPNTAAHVLNLPAISGLTIGDSLTFFKSTSDAKAITLTGAGSDKVDGSATVATMDAQYDTITIKAVATNVYGIVAQKIA